MTFLTGLGGSRNKKKDGLDWSKTDGGVVPWARRELAKAIGFQTSSA
jgi:hypothetical protein